MFASVASKRDPQWWFALLGGVGAGCAYLLAGLGVWLLVRERGSRLAALGAVATGLGGILFAAGLFAFGAVRPIAVTGIVARDALPTGSITATIDYCADTTQPPYPR